MHPCVTGPCLPGIYENTGGTHIASFYVPAASISSMHAYTIHFETLCAGVCDGAASFLHAAVSSLARTVWYGPKIRHVQTNKQNKTKQNMKIHLSQTATVVVKVRTNHRKTQKHLKKNTGTALEWGTRTGRVQNIIINF